MAILTSLTINDTGYLQVASGISSDTIENKQIFTSTSYDCHSVGVGTNRIVIGDTGSNRVCVFDLEGRELYTIGGSGTFGSSVGVGSTMIIVGAETSGTSGSAYVYDLDGTYIRTLTPSSALSSSKFGCSVAIGENRILVGCYLDSNGGSAFLYDFSGTQIAKLKPNDILSGDQFGFSVGCGSTTVAVGAYGHDTPSIDGGAVYIFNNSGTQINKINGGSSQFGYNLSMNSEKIVIGNMWGLWIHVCDTSGNNLTQLRLNKPYPSSLSNYSSVGISTNYIFSYNRAGTTPTSDRPINWSIEIFDYDLNPVSGFTLQTTPITSGGDGISVFGNKVVYRNDVIFSTNNANILTIPEKGMLRYNSDFDILEFYTKRKWSSLSYRDISSTPLYYDENLINLYDFSDRRCKYSNNRATNLSIHTESGLTLYNSPVVDEDDGYSLVFNGTNQYGTITHKSELNSNEITVCMWVKVSGNNYQNCLIAKSPTDTTNGTFYTQCFTSANTFTIQSFQTSSSGIQGSGSLNNKWVFIGVTQKPYEYKMFLDDWKRWSVTTNNYTPNNTSTIYIGSLNGSTQFLSGKIGLIAIYNRVLSDSELRTFYHGTKRKFGL